ncbi:hypothetical protein HMN09_00102700 [Mycena chlorophos]|uniref:D-lactate dehydrogenase (cytochrome) n=1 Tax=Mycena chlorophos TaxID=658473 RepID=A0A8H6TT39_MYCCL|nr:hypothetical protein HMN09_00102700 [Mycena chlorophos]
MFSRLCRRRLVFDRPFSTTVLRREAPPNLRSSFDSAKARKPSTAASPPPELPSPGWYRYSPWSDKFTGTLQTRVLLQAFVYALLIAGATNYVDSIFFPTAQQDAKPKYASPQEVKTAIQKLRDTFPEPGRVDTNPDAVRTAGSSENSYHPASAHSVIVRVLSTEDVVKVVNIAREFKVPVTALSGATSLEGHFSGYATGSICIDLSGMDKIIRINEPDSDLVCQAGARWEDINQTLKDQGIPLFFPLDPGPGATIGGMVGTGCSGNTERRRPSGSSTLQARHMALQPLAHVEQTVVLPTGEVIKTRRRSRKSSAGWDATKLFIGAEGTLGIVTEATLRLAPALPTRVALAQFPDVQKAVSAVQEILNTPYGAHVQCVELVDDQMMDAMNRGGLLDRAYPVQDTLFFKLQGDETAIDLTSKTIKVLVKKHGSTKFEFARTEEEADNLWQNRKYALPSTLAAYPGKRCWTTDVCVPVSRLPELVLESKKDLAAAGLSSTILGHVGDGNYHQLLLFGDDEEYAKVKDAVHRLVYRALALDGTCTGEHGVGVGKKEYLVEELGLGTVALMKQVKKAIDPYNIMNPGKLYPD